MGNSRRVAVIALGGPLEEVRDPPKVLIAPEDTEPRMRHVARRGLTVVPLERSAAAATSAVLAIDLRGYGVETFSRRFELSAAGVPWVSSSVAAGCSDLGDAVASSASLPPRSCWTILTAAAPPSRLTAEPELREEVAKVQFVALGGSSDAPSAESSRRCWHHSVSAAPRPAGRVTGAAAGFERPHAPGLRVPADAHRGDSGGRRPTRRGAREPDGAREVVRSRTLDQPSEHPGRRCALPGARAHPPGGPSGERPYGTSRPRTRASACWYRPTTPIPTCSRSASHRLRPSCTRSGTLHRR